MAGDGTGAPTGRLACVTRRGAGVKFATRPVVVPGGGVYHRYMPDLPEPLVRLAVIVVLAALVALDVARERRRGGRQLEPALRVVPPVTATHDDRHRHTVP